MEIQVTRQKKNRADAENHKYLTGYLVMHCCEQNTWLN